MTQGMPEAQSVSRNTGVKQRPQDGPWVAGVKQRPQHSSLDWCLLNRTQSCQGSTQGMPEAQSEGKNAGVKQRPQDGPLCDWF